MCIAPMLKNCGYDQLTIGPAVTLVYTDGFKGPRGVKILHSVHFHTDFRERW